MKTIANYSIALAIILGLSLCSCNIDEEIIDVPTPEDIRTQADVTTIINGTYSIISDQQCFKFQGMQLLFLSADDMYSELGNISTRKYNSSEVSVQSFWTSMYAVIRNANNLIDALDKLNLDPAFEKRAYGDAYFLRGFTYFYLVQMYGGVPLRTQSVNLQSDFYIARNTVDEVYAQIFADFKAASVNLPLQSAIGSQELGRASKGAAQSFMAIASLTYGNHLQQKSQTPDTHYQNAKVYADSVIASNQYILINDFAQLFDISRENDAYKEVIFGIRFVNDKTRTGAGSRGSEFAQRCMPNNFTDVAGGNPITHTGGGSYRFHPWIADFYTTGEYLNDYRAQVTFTSRGFNSVQQKFVVTYPTTRVVTTGTNADMTNPSAFCGKYVDPQGTDRNHENDFFMMRLAEVYLIKAEAENELNGPTPAAYEAFNQLRVRARRANGIARTTPANLTAGLTKDQFRLRVFNERGAELLGEGHRWFDLVRMQSPTNASETMYDYQFFTFLTAKPNKLPTYNATNNKWNNTGGVFIAAIPIPKETKFKLFPIPENERANNPNFGSQNSGW